eukprot:scaffold2364_cov426-Prasinococcus_capsulatus_cf.AAC.18
MVPSLIRVCKQCRVTGAVGDPHPAGLYGLGAGARRRRHLALGLPTAAADKCAGPLRDGAYFRGRHGRYTNVHSLLLLAPCVADEQPPHRSTARGLGNSASMSQAP